MKSDIIESLIVVKIFLINAGILTFISLVDINEWMKFVSFFVTISLGLWQIRKEFIKWKNKKK